MKIDPNRYVASYPFIKRLYDRAMEAGTKDQLEVIAELSLASMVPVLAITMYVQREYGTNESLDKSVESLVAFYKYTDVIQLD